MKYIFCIISDIFLYWYFDVVNYTDTYSDGKSSMHNSNRAYFIMYSGSNSWIQLANILFKIFSL